MGFKVTKDLLKQLISYEFTTAQQLKNSRWQIFVLLFGIVSTFWALLVGKIFDSESFGEMYLLIFLGIIFTILLLFAWRFINHLLLNEEVENLDAAHLNLFLLEQLSKRENFPKMIEEDLYLWKDKMTTEKLKIDHLMEGLSNEFDYFFKNDPDHKADSDLRKMFRSLNDDKKRKLSDELHYIRFEKGQWTKDLGVFCLIALLWAIGFYFCILMNNSINEGSNPFFSFILKNPGLSDGILVLLLFGLYIYFMVYINQNNFLLRNSDIRRDEIKGKIEHLIEEQNKDEEEGKKEHESFVLSGIIYPVLFIERLQLEENS